MAWGKRKEEGKEPSASQLAALQAEALARKIDELNVKINELDKENQQLQARIHHQEGDPIVLSLQIVSNLRKINDLNTQRARLFGH